MLFFFTSTAGPSVTGSAQRPLVSIFHTHTVLSTPAETIPGLAHKIEETGLVLCLQIAAAMCTLFASLMLIWPRTASLAVDIAVAMYMLQLCQ